ncbi:MAG: HD-GYP domain-containing protein [Bdellovibrio sp.]
MSQAIKILEVGVSNIVQKEIMKLVPNASVDTLTNMKSLLAFGARPATENDHQVIFLGSECEGIKSVTELIQAAKMIYHRGQPVFFVTSDAKSFDREMWKKNGCNEAFIFPMDGSHFSDVISSILVTVENKNYSPVSLLDIEEETRLDFDIMVYLPANKRFIPYSAAGHTLDSKRLENLRHHKVKSIYVPIKQLQSYYDYSTGRLHSLYAGNCELSESARQKKLQESVRELITNMISERYSQTFQKGKEVASHARKIVDGFITLTSKAETAEKIKKEIGGEDNAYSHSSSVVKFAAMIGVLLDQKKIEDVSVAGLFHDLGLSEISPELQKKNFKDLTASEKDLYSAHSFRTVEILKSRKLSFSPDVITAIEQHHENWLGTGYPNKVEGRKMSEISQILILADRLDYLTRFENGAISMSFEQAIEQIKREQLVNPLLMAKLQSALSVINAA